MTFNCGRIRARERERRQGRFMMEKDLKLEILDILEDNAKTTADEMALMLNVDAATIEKTVKELEDEKAIIKYSALVNRDVVDEDAGAEALIEVEITPQRDYGYDDMAKRIYRFEEVRAVYLMAGTYDLCVRIKSRSMKDISKFVFEKLSVIDGGPKDGHRIHYAQI